MIENVWYNKDMTIKELQKNQRKMHAKIYQCAQKQGLIKENPPLEPICDGAADIEGYLSSNPKIMWLLKEPYDDFTVKGKPKGGGWPLTTHLRKSNIWQDDAMWKLMIQITYAIHNDLNWEELDYISDNPEMKNELSKIAYINLSKMPYDTESSDTHLWECYRIWKDILLEQIQLYTPDIIIFGNTFKFFQEDLQITEKPIRTVSGQWNTNAYKKNNMILIDAYHPSRKGGEDGGCDYATSIIKAVRKFL